eukprot:1303051-Alexandrium_andersonii.AAC.1
MRRSGPAASIAPGGPEAARFEQACAAGAAAGAAAPLAAESSSKRSWSWRIWASRRAATLR